MRVEILDEHLGMLAEKSGFPGKQQFPAEVVQVYRRRLFQIKNAGTVQDLRNYKSLHFEKLAEKRYKGKYSIRLVQGFRLIFQISKDEKKVDIILIEEISNHYQ